MTKTKELAELCAILGQHIPKWAPDSIVRLAIDLRRLSARNARAQVRACNDSDYSQEQAGDVETTCLAKAIKLLEGTGIKVAGCDDPRGYAMHLHFKSGRYNTMGGKEQGWGI